MKKGFKSVLAGSVSALALAASAHAENFNIPDGDLQTALNAYAKQTNVALIYPDTEVRQVHTRGAHGDLTPYDALAHLLKGTGFTTQRTPSGAIGIVRAPEPAQEASSHVQSAEPVRVAAAASVETVVVTSSKIKGDIQTVPIAITALSQEQLTSRQIAGGPDLVKEVPNLTFSKTNFTGYNIEIRGIGTQAISVATDPAVAVALNDIPFIRNHFFEQEFYDVGQVEVLRGPQGTLYGRNATAGVVNVVSAKPTDQFEAMLSADWGNYSNRRYEGMVNIPIVDDRLDIRVAGEWTKRDGYTYNETTGQNIDGRDLWSSRVTIGWKPFAKVQTYLVWEHFSENDDRLRTSKQLCEKDPGVQSVDGLSTNVLAGNVTVHDILSQGCKPASLYSADSFETPNGNSLPFVLASEGQFKSHVPGISQNVQQKDANNKFIYLLNSYVDPYASGVQSRNLRVIESSLTPHYRAKNDTLEFNASWDVTPSLSFASQTGYNHDFLYSTEDFNRFQSSPGIFSPSNESPNGVFCDPQLGCSDRLVGEDLSDEHAWQLSQEFRLASNFKGPLNFSVGGNYLHYETEENYYVFINVLTDIAEAWNGNEPFPNPPGVTDIVNECAGATGSARPIPHTYGDPTHIPGLQQFCIYIDPNPISHLDNNGHNYFLSQNPYTLNSYAGFGEVYYQLLPDLKLTGGLRWTDDKKHFLEIPSWTAIQGWGYPVAGAVDQEWQKMTGRAVADWTPKLDFTDQTLIYASYSRGYKAGGANPPLPVLQQFSTTHPKTFAPEFVNAYELGTKNTMLDGGLTLNGDVFYYDYKGYQISQIVDRTSVNLNFNATVKGAEMEASYEPLPGLKFSFAGGYEDTKLAKGSQAIDLMDRTAGNLDWVVSRPFVTSPSNCVIPAKVEEELIEEVSVSSFAATYVLFACEQAYAFGHDPAAGYKSKISDYVPWVPSTAPNGGAGFYKDLSGNELPNAPKFTTSLSADYTMPVSEDWAATLHSDFYWQSQSWARVFNDRPYDKIRGYSNVNLALILTSASGWQVMGYLKNVFNTTAITGDFLNSDDTGLTTNVFLTDPRLYGVRITKNW